MIKFKHEKDMELFFVIKPALAVLLFGCVQPVIEREIPDYNVTVTRTVDKKIPGESVSNTHLEGRAVDIRIKDMPKDAPKKIVTELNLLLSDSVGAVSLSNNKKKFAVLESDHIHFQIHPNVDVEDVKLLLTSSCAWARIQQIKSGNINFGLYR